MSEEKIREALGMPEEKPEVEEQPVDQEEAIEPESVEEEVTPEEPEWTQEKWQETQEDMARSHGWKPFDEYVSEGGDPKEWRTAEGFNIRGEFIGKMRDNDRKTERIVEERVSGVKKLQEARIKQLERERDEAIGDGDVEKVHSLEQEIGDLQTPVQAAPVIDPDLEAKWNAENQWIAQKGAKSVYATTQYAQYINSGLSTADALAKVDADVAREFGKTEKKSPPPPSEKGKGGRGFRTPSAPKLSMGDLTRQELNVWRELSHAWGGDENKFLQAVADDRKAQK